MSYRGKSLLKLLQKANNYNNFVANLILKSLKDKKKILDFGAGYGYFAQMLRDNGVLNISCVEIDEELNEHCQNLDFIVFENLHQITNEKFDFIYSLNVLEHIDDDKKTLLMLKDLLNENGKLFIYVPAFQILYSEFDKKIGHFRRYRKNDLTNFLSDNDFKIIQAKYVDSVGFILALAYKFLHKNQGQINEFQIFIFDKILFPIGRIFDVLTAGKLFGKNLIIEAQLKG